MAEVARELRFADGAAAPQEPGDQAGGPNGPEAAAVARESGCGGDDMSLSGASDGRPLSDATRKVLISYPLVLGNMQDNSICKALCTPTRSSFYAIHTGLLPMETVLTCYIRTARLRACNGQLARPKAQTAATTCLAGHAC